jgi:predicted RNA-binding Zn-ribbon protein involved in translation (DUF1610 family)
MKAALSYHTVTLTPITCVSCGIEFAVPEDYEAKLRRSHKHFYCPNGHDLHFPGKSDVERERESRIMAEARAAQAEDRAEVTERRRRAEKGQRTRLLNRIHNGVCPHCKRTFADLAKHMASKHPDARSEVGA